jgi:hypothetical protein
LPGGVFGLVGVALSLALLVRFVDIVFQG